MISALLLGLAASASCVVGQPVNQTEASVTQDSLENPFSFTPNPSPTYAKGNGNSSVAHLTTSYAPHYTDIADKLLGSVSTTTWGKWDPSPNATRATDTDDKYGQHAWSQMWIQAPLRNYTDHTSLYSTTVEPTPVPSASLVLPPEDPFIFNDTLKFPQDFMFGVSGSALQIEGAVADEGRSPSIFEVIMIYDYMTQDYVANENYYLYKQDIARLAAMGVKYYSFSISWNRIMPFTLPGSPVNQHGIDHYNDVIQTCLDYGITPVATLLHFDTPLVFVDDIYSVDPSVNILGINGGYDNATFVDAFVNYGKIVLSHFADRVPLWFGFNEPFLYAGNPVGVKHVLQAQAQLHKFYHEELGATGKFGIKFNDNFAVPRDPTNEDDVAAANRFQDFYLGIFSNPLFLGKDYPDSYKQTFAGANFSEPITFTDEELQAIHGGSDFFGIDPYTYTVVTPAPGGIDACQANSSHPLWPFCVVQTSTREDGWAIGYGSQSYVYITPAQVRQFLNYIWDTWKTPVLVAEFGFPEWREGEKELKDQLYDIDRSIYLRSYLEAIAQAINLDNVQVMGAIVWAFADNWEWGDFKQQFGLQAVNRTTQERYYKKSFFDVMKYVDDRRAA